MNGMRLALAWGITLCVFLECKFTSRAQSNRTFSFNQITTDDGLSHNQISSIYEDESGFMWFGTLSGLNRYDGYKSEVFLHSGSDSVSLINNTIISIYAGPSNNIWVQTGEGISIYDPSLERFVDPAPWTSRLNSSDADILGAEVDQFGNAWFNIRNKGLIKQEMGSDSLRSINTAADSYIQIASNQITDMIQDRSGNLWIISAAGEIEVIDTEINKVIRKFNVSDHRGDVDYFEIFIDSADDLWLHSSDDRLGLIYLNTTNGLIKKFDEKTLSSRVVRDVIEDDKGLIWVGTDHGGITVLNKDDWKVRTLKHQVNNAQSLSDNSITYLYKASNGFIWIGKTKNGISYYNSKASNFDHYRFDHHEPSYNDMSSLAEDANGDIWIGTNGQGLLKFNSKTRRIRKVNLLDPTNTSLGSNVVVSLHYGTDGSLWVGTYLQGLYRYKNGTLSNYRHGSTLPSLSDNNIWSIYEDGNGYIWLGTLQAGLDKFDPATGQVVNYRQGNELLANYVTRMTEDNQKRLWIATGHGLTRHDPADMSFRHYTTTDSGDHRISSNSVISLLYDSRGNLWAGTMRGLNLYKPELDGFVKFNESDGLSSDIIMSLVEDNNGHLWIGTSRGISKLTFHQGKPVIEAFDRSDGLQGDSFNEGAALRTRDGLLVFSGQTGLNVFDPSKVIVQDQPPKMAFTSFSLNSSKVRPGQRVGNRVILDKSLDETHEIILKHDENSFAFEFVALTYDQVSKNKYQYMLQGFDKDWINVPSEVRMANYTNLDFGQYQLRVRAANNHNIWNEEGLTMNVIIQPPFWKTPWAYGGYVAFTVILLFLTRQAIVSRERTKAKIENDRLQAQRLHELDLMKIKFFTNISHEFRTPISLVLTPIERMIKYPDKVKVADFKLIQRNAKRLLTLVNQLLDFRKMEANQHKLHNSSGDLVKFVRHVLESFTDMSREKEIELTLETDLNQFYTQFDKDKLDKILFNLLSNAFKFTMNGGRIIVELEHQDGGIVLSVTDTGIGIPADKQGVIFDRFMQSDLKDHMINSGTGIGLSITKEFVELHGGTIRVDSTPDEGSTFTLEFPFKRIEHEQVVEEVASEQVNESVQPVIDHTKPTIFLVEDNADFRFYLKDNLRQYFNVSESYNGKEAWKSILATKPDMVISDVMMPVMNGLELCRKIKNDPRTSGIPVILLTAQSADDSKIDGLEAGAIEYISKPFNFEILVSTINSALKFQKRVNESSKQIKVQPAEVEVVSRDEKLVQDALELVESRISDANFGVEQLSHELGLSRGHLYQKMLKLTGQTPIDFIREIRIKRAAELLEKSQMTVSQVAYAVGYNNPKLFSRYFKSKYKVYPSQYHLKFQPNQES